VTGWWGAITAVAVAVYAKSSEEQAMGIGAHFKFLQPDGCGQANRKLYARGDAKHPRFVARLLSRRFLAR
jgi:hypothetical protein